jgi:hypothetical protein
MGNIMTRRRTMDGQTGDNRRHKRWGINSIFVCKIKKLDMSPNLRR